ncbi:hypothetical protein DL764_007775 [Monosporascus ibericus]|uniref:SWIM-type domain-containing protein n=1 Tax=Monosporascus ibericus TaxID=155417 RepID=A0A4Q4SZ96_9PEZI|nr:hypothetical protein DL764_007775 [Monosporascus ibericus]
MAAAPPLPAPRTLLTSLINTLASAPLAPPDPALANPLKRLPASHRTLLATLHALYPSLLLPALDVLDRRLVTKVFVDGGSGGAGASTAAASAGLEQGRSLGTGVDLSAGPGARDTVSVSGVGASEGAGATLESRQADPGADPVPSSSRPLAATDAEASPGTGVPEGGDGGRRGEKHPTRNWQRLSSEPTFHIVRSAQPSQSFRRQHGHNQFNPNTRQQRYVVRLGAWSCTCAAFAFSAYPFEAPASRDANPNPARQRGQVAGVGHYYAIEPAAASSSSSSGLASAARDTGDSGRDEDEPEWEFGGLSIDGRDDGEGSAAAAAAGMGSGAAAGVPACKHLLACVLGERLAGLGLGEYMDERRVGREEGAGLVGEV